MKYVGLAGLLVLALVLVAGWKMAMNPVSTMSVGDGAGASAATVEMHSVESDVVRTRQLNASLDRLAAVVFTADAGAPLIAYRPTAQRDPALLARLLAQTGSAPAERQVSLLYSGADFNRAVVNGQYVRRGDRLADGSRVLRITRNLVEVQGADGRRILRVPEGRRAIPAPK